VKTASGAQGERQVTVLLHDNLDPLHYKLMSAGSGPVGLDGQAPSASAVGQPGGGVHDAVARVFSSAWARMHPRVSSLSRASRVAAIRAAACRVSPENRLRLTVDKDTRRTLYSQVRRTRSET
jgi:hypothetical protein